MSDSQHKMKKTIEGAETYLGGHAQDLDSNENADQSNKSQPTNGYLMVNPAQILDDGQGTEITKIMQNSSICQPKALLPNIKDLTLIYSPYYSNLDNFTKKITLLISLLFMDFF